LLGRLIAYSGMLEGKEVTCFPSYGAEMRGGTANSTVIVSDEMIGSPITGNPDILIAIERGVPQEVPAEDQVRGSTYS